MSQLDQKARLSSAKQALLKKWLQEGVKSQTIPKRSREDHPPLSFAQQRLWLLDQLVPNSPAYNISHAVRLEGVLHVIALEQSLNEIINRHEALRTTFTTIGEQPVQVIASELTLVLPVRDLSKLAADEQESAIQQFVTEATQLPFDLNRGPLLRVNLLKLNQAEHILAITMHHIISDGWSIGIFIREFATLYQAFSAGKASPLPQLPIQYADFAVWQRQQLQDILETQLAYWKRQLANASEVLELPADHPRPTIQTFQGRSQIFSLSPGLTAALKTVSQQEGVSLFMTLLAAFSTLLYRYTRQSDINIGTPIANRNRTELEDLIGFFANTLVIRTSLSGNSTFQELLKQIRTVTLEAYAHQDLPFEQLAEELQPERDMSRNPLFQVMFALQNAPIHHLEVPQLKLSFLEAYNKTAKFDLWLSMEEEGEALTGIIEYNSELFNVETIDRLSAHFQSLLEAISLNPAQPISDLPLLTTAEQQLLSDWNNTTTSYLQTQGYCLHNLIEAQVVRTPDKVALSFEDSNLTYRELNVRANKLAHYLQSLGVGPDVLVGIYTERSLEMVVGLLGILKAGGAYVPLDPTYPAERLAFMLADSQVSVLLTQQQLVDRLPKLRKFELFCLDSDWHLLNQEAEINPSSGATEDNLAYMIYTSGSTGQPKGAMNSHRAINNRLLWMQEQYQLTETDTVLQKTPFSFDVSVWEFFWPLLSGARLVIALPEGHRDPAYLVKLIIQQQVTTLHFVPSMLDIFLEEKGLEQCTSLRRVICSGEALPFSFQHRFFARLEAELHNLYGPTEAAVDVTCWACQPEDHRRTVPIGTPIANIQIYLLDQFLNPVPVGVPGELYIGGVGLARGYFQRPALTAEKFIPNPFLPQQGGERQGERLYKTGDLARYLPDGTIEFLGRLDHQVKLRGIRIELGEIEFMLRQHTSLRDAVVLDMDQKLVAYLVPTALYQNAIGLSTSQVSEWQQVFDQIYEEGSLLPDPTFNTAGWNSSYTGLPLSSEEMNEWVEQTIERILSTHPDRILEIGCGTGLLLFRLAPHCKEYWGTDFSTIVLDYLEQQLANQPHALPQVKLLQYSADNFTSIAQTFEAVILNSVVQYFPSIDYLQRTLAGVISLVEPGGIIFINDVRSLPLLEAFHISVALSQASPSLSTVQLQQQVQLRINQEQELVVSPTFFVALQQQLPQITHVDIQLKRGRYHNELTRFRYDVTLYIGTEMCLYKDVLWLDWQADYLSVTAIRQLLLETEPELLGIANVPNARLATEIKALEILNSDNVPETVADLQEACQTLEMNYAIDPEEFWNLGDEVGYGVNIRWMGSGVAGSYEVVFQRRIVGKEALVGLVPSQTEGQRDLQAWTSYANNPLERRLARQLIPEIQKYLKEKLPAYMIPSAFVILENLPLTSNGKLNRKLLPEPMQAIPEFGTGFAPPRTPVEKLLAHIWAQVLGLEQVGIHNNFFELGGDSIHSIQVTTRANQAGLQLVPKDIFQYQTIGELASVIKVISPTLREPNLPTEPFPLTPAQYLLLEQSLVEPARSSQVMLLETTANVDVSILEKTIQHLLIRHPTLRLCFEQSGTNWQQLVNPNLAPDIPLLHVDLLTQPEADHAIIIQATIKQLQASLDLPGGVVFQAAFLDLDSTKPGYLLLVIHHLVADDISWQILLEDIQTIYHQLKNDEIVHLPATTSFQQWSHQLAEYAQSAALLQELPYWSNESRSRITRLPIDYLEDEIINFNTETQIVSGSLTVNETQALLQRGLKAYRTQVEDLLLTALVQVMSDWAKIDTLLIDWQTQGRSASFAEVDLSRTVGCFTTHFPVPLTKDKADSPGTLIKMIKEQLRTIPNDGMGYSLLYYLKQDPEVAKQLQSLPKAEVSFNYLGQVDEKQNLPSLFKVVNLFNRAADSLPAAQNYLLRLTGRIIEGRLQVDWAYNPSVHDQSAVENLGKIYIEALRSLISHCLSAEAGGYTSSDFPLAKLTQLQLDQLQLDDPLNIEDVYPLTPMQQSMLAQQLHHAKPGLYIIHQNFLLQGVQLNVPAFEKAWQWVVNQHPPLRTAFVWQGLDEPFQVVYQRVNLTLEQHDWRGLPAADQARQLDEYIQAVRHRGFELSTAPHTCLALFHIAENVYRFIWVFNYMLQEGWSLPIITMEFFACYEAFCQGHAIHLEQRRPFRDYIAWLQQQNLAESELFWKRLLKGFSTPTPLPVSQNITPLSGRQDGYSKQQVILSVTATTALRSLARRCQLTLNTLIQGAWALLLSCYSGKQDVVFGVIVSGRPTALRGVEQMVGFFNNLMPLRIQVPAEASLLEWLKGIQAKQVELSQHQYSSPLQVKEWSEVSPDQPLFESYLVYENFPMDPSLESKSRELLGITELDSLTQTEHPLRVEIFPNPVPALVMIYSHSYFNDDTISCLLHDLQVLLEGMTKNPAQLLSELMRLIHPQYH